MLPFDGFHHPETYFGAAVIQDSIQVIRQHLGQSLKLPLAKNHTLLPASPPVGPVDETLLTAALDGDAVVTAHAE